jgi:hypothetical protein
MNALDDHDVAYKLQKICGYYTLTGAMGGGKSDGKDYIPELALGGAEYSH